MPKLPCPPPPDRLRNLGTDLHTLPAESVLWRLHNTVGSHVLAWNALRRFGPTSSRFDPHTPPPHTQARGVTYLAADLATALAERFQEDRTVDRRFGSPHLTAFATTTALDLLNLTGAWPLRVGASHAINTGRRDVSRQWARAIVTAWPDTAGLWHTSSMTARPCVVLYDPGAPAVPERPDFSVPLHHPGLTGRLVAATTEIGYRLL